MKEFFEIVATLGVAGTFIYILKELDYLRHKVDGKKPKEDKEVKKLFDDVVKEIRSWGAPEK